MKKREAPKIKALIFDIGGVQLYYNHWLAARPMAKVLGISAKKVHGVIADTGSHPGFVNLCETQNSEKKYWQHAAKLWGIDWKDFPMKKIDALWNKIFFPNKNILKLLPKLKPKYKLGLLSNMGCGHKKYLKKKHNVHKPFTKPVFSCDVGVRKPNPKIYQITLKRLNAKPQETVFIDDLPRNIKAANKLGIHGILYKNHNKFLKEMKELGVEW